MSIDKATKTLNYTNRYIAWLRQKPPAWRIIARIRWKRNKPVMED